MEHPAEPPEQDAASVWRLEVISRYCQLDFVRRFFFRQGELGQRSLKPTELLACRVPGLERCYEGLKTAASGSGLRHVPGRRLDTASLKVYPARMCIMIIASVWHTYACRVHGVTVATEALDEALPRVKNAGLRLEREVTDTDPENVDLPDDIDLDPDLRTMAEWPIIDAQRGPDYAR